jgi:hypothetical protein
MADSFRIATKVPWEDHIREWSPRFGTAEAVSQELLDRANHPEHRGQGFQFRMRCPGDDFGPKRTFKDLRDTATRRLKAADFGDMLLCKALKDNVVWHIRKIKEDDPALDLPEANSHIDYLYTYFFRDHKKDFAAIENWGTCNRRYIDGTTDWSQHSPWLAPDAGCNAIDIHSSYQVMFNVSRRASSLGAPHVAKILFYGQEWLPEGGWRSVSGIGHYDHVHIEGPRDHGGLAGACNY